GGPGHHHDRRTRSQPVLPYGSRHSGPGRQRQVVISVPVAGVTTPATGTASRQATPPVHRPLRQLGGSERFACQGQRPFSSTSSEKLSTVRIATMTASAPRLWNVGESATVCTMSPAT